MKLCTLNIVAVLVQALFVFAAQSASTSFASIRSKESIDSDKYTSALDIIDSANSENPVVLFEFENLQLIRALIEDKSGEVEYPYLERLFKDEITNVFDETELPVDQNNDAIIMFTVSDLTKKTSIQLMYDSPVEERNVIWFQFTGKEYDLNELDSFIESAVMYLEEYLDINIDIILNTKGENDLNKLYEKFDKEPTAFAVDQSHSNKPSSSKSDDTEKDDSLSRIWTEGLLMCLLVSFLLLVLLFVALSWLASVEISYTGLEKPANPLKKNQ
ncbi:Voa1p KNAG_0B00980 [Huiozyma naganishii CBS 8797]|uniref:V-type proton ATPase subunit S1/VOA1 transmembrane domain-containing protein n=1 Tax=Huiozyma naganishii (strain ATCC MYA-139 / BCRC 22969 / CBS 8797 / KCTC 17520 / NBRC 10181 / NCYC 3082 / Yp74L-3) TaxID=1071383 RepID=J7R176_HUIN7|nr:hypothetical protein KNAG_0B00980 [Kazachstania naganishii CBS 8797]CCK68545.1 hypothetical protein KNAG_0B00980 [Kazachstania naganishii CBS 8797]